MTSILSRSPRAPGIVLAARIRTDIDITLCRAFSKPAALFREWFGRGVGGEGPGSHLARGSQLPAPCKGVSQKSGRRKTASLLFSPSKQPARPKGRPEALGVLRPAATRQEAHKALVDLLRPPASGQPPGRLNAAPRPQFMPGNLSLLRRNRGLRKSALRPQFAPAKALSLLLCPRAQDRLPVAIRASQSAVTLAVSVGSTTGKPSGP